jgi:oligopeptide transport system substrate-binding protein
MLHATRNTQHALSAVLLVLVFTACSPPRPPADLRVVNGAEPGSLDPATSTGLEELRVTMALFEGLMRVDPVSAQPIPGLAERYEVSTDFKAYTFHLRTSAVWSTGERITAHDFEYSWFRVLDPATASEYHGQLYYIKNAERWFNKQLTNRSEVGIHAPDDFTLQVELENPTPFFLDLCAFQTLYVVPRHLIERHGVRWMRVRPLSVSGPYQL